MKNARQDCAYCPEKGADVCVRVVSDPGPDRLAAAHRSCAEKREATIMFGFVDEPAEQAR